MRNSIEKVFDINLLNIKKNVEYFDFQIDKKFFENFDQDIIEDGDVKVSLSVSKTDLMITMNFEFLGSVNLTCDKSLEKFDKKIHTSKIIFFKFGKENAELDVDLFQIENNTININVATHILEFLLLEIPFRKLHPKYSDEGESDEEELLYQTDIGQNIEEETDPRWSGLEKLKGKFK